MIQPTWQFHSDISCHGAGESPLMCYCKTCPLACPLAFMRDWSSAAKSLLENCMAMAVARSAIPI